MADVTGIYHIMSASYRLLNDTKIVEKTKRTPLDTSGKMNNDDESVVCL